MFGKSIEEVLNSIDIKDAGKPRKKVTILGGGMAGLTAAYELERLGHEVKLIEAQNRVGGRVITWRPSKNSSYHELGAMRIPSTHDYTHYYIYKCGLKLRTFVNHHDDPDGFYFIRGINTTRADSLNKLVSDAQYSGLSDRERKMILDASLPIGLMAPLGETANQVRKDPDSLRALFGKGAPTPFITKLESQTIYEYLREKLDTELAVELVGVVTGLEVWWDKAVTMLLRDEVSQHGSTGLQEIVGGMDLLPNTLLEKIENRVDFEFGREIVGIHNKSGRIQIVHRAVEDIEDVIREDCEIVLCTIPFGVLRRIETTGFSPGKMRAIRGLTYASSTKVLLLCKERFWEKNYGVFGSGSQTDLINRQIYYLAD